MASLVKPGGKIILYFVEHKILEEESFYVVGSEMFCNLHISKANALKGIEDAGFYDLRVTTLPREEIDNPHPSLVCFYLVSATKL